MFDVPNSTKVLLFTVPALVYIGLGALGLVPMAGLKFVFGGAALIVHALRSHGRDVKTAFASLPFPVVHSPVNVMQMPSLSFVQEVRIRLVARLDGMSADHFAAEAQAQVRGVHATMSVADGVILLTGWFFKYDDARALSRLLDTWGRRVHATAGIAEVHVTWK